jgi:Fe-S-cluster containining protein
LADGLGIGVEELGRRYLRRVGSRVSLVERQDGDCVFWSNTEGCTVYEARPSQCRTFPFWQGILKNEGSWAAAGGSCPGVGEGRLYTLGEIEALAGGTGDTGPADDS